MKVYTKRGDRGETDLFGGERVAKSHPRVDAYGEVDELNSTIGLACAHSSQDDVRALVARIQSALFDLGAYLATPDAHNREKGGLLGVAADEVTALEHAIDGFETELEPLKTFILPGGTLAASAFHVARTVCRRAERKVVELDRSDGIDGAALQYLNRLSDLLFVLGRLENRRAGLPDTPWVSRN